MVDRHQPSHISSAPSQRWAVPVFGVHLCWLLAWIGAAVVSSAVFCGGNDDCRNFQFIFWGMPWIAGELLLLPFLVFAALDLIRAALRAPDRDALVGFALLAAFPVVFVVASLLTA